MTDDARPANGTEHGEPPVGAVAASLATPARRPRRTAPLIAGIVGVAASALVVVFAIAPAGRGAEETSELVGEVAPALSGATLNGDRFDLDRQRGRWVLVNFFATWCPPCVQEHPELVRFSERTGGVAQVVSVAYDEDDVDALQQFFDERGGDWPVVVGGAGRVALEYGVKKLPESFLIDPGGVVVAKINGGVTAAELEQLIAQSS